MAGTGVPRMLLAAAAAALAAALAAGCGGGRTGEEGTEGEGASRSGVEAGGRQPTGGVGNADTVVGHPGINPTQQQAADTSAPAAAPAIRSTGTVERPDSARPDSAAPR
jgi:hypothetical protein